jgi:hypothetical protein
LLNEPFDHRPFVLLCEGLGDHFEARNIGSDFSVRVPFIAGQYAGGRSQFGRYLSSISVDEAFVENVKVVLIVSDNDTDPAVSFAEVQEEIRSSKTFPAPTAELAIARSKDGPAVVVLMLPMGDGPGNLESLCYEAAMTKWPLLIPHLDEFVGNCPPAAWSLGKQAKMRMQTILASTNDQQPDTGFAGHWNQPAQFRVPLDHACFDELTEFLRNFSEFVRE